MSSKQLFLLFLEQVIFNKTSSHSLLIWFDELASGFGMYNFMGIMGWM